MPESAARRRMREEREQAAAERHGAEETPHASRQPAALAAGHLRAVLADYIAGGRVAAPRYEEADIVAVLDERAQLLADNAEMHAAFANVVLVASRQGGEIAALVDGYIPDWRERLAAASAEGSDDA